MGVCQWRNFIYFFVAMTSLPECVLKYLGAEDVCTNGVLRKQFSNVRSVL